MTAKHTYRIGDQVTANDRGRTVAGPITEFLTQTTKRTATGQELPRKTPKVFACILERPATQDRGSVSVWIALSNCRPA